MVVVLEEEEEEEREEAPVEEVPPPAPPLTFLMSSSPLLHTSLTRSRCTVKSVSKASCFFSKPWQRLPTEWGARVSSGGGGGSEELTCTAASVSP